MEVKTIVLNEERHVTLECCLQPVGEPYDHIKVRPAVIVCPGGGYTHLAGRESEPVAFAFMRAGFQVFILRYGINEYAAWPGPLEDYEQAKALIESTPEWNVAPGKTCVIGFSAGAHLAACAATMSVHRPDAAILGYGLFIGEDARQYLADAPDVISAVDGRTCPCFLFSSTVDPVVPIRNSLALMNALTEHGVGYEAHLYSSGSHGFSVGDETVFCSGVSAPDRAERWPDDCLSWLEELWSPFFE